MLKRNTHRSGYLVDHLTSLANSRTTRLLVAFVAAIWPWQTAYSHSCGCGLSGTASASPTRDHQATNGQSDSSRCCGCCQSTHQKAPSGCPFCQVRQTNQRCTCGETCRCDSAPLQPTTPPAPLSRPPWTVDHFEVVASPRAVLRDRGGQLNGRLLAQPAGKAESSALSPLERCRRLSRFAL